MLPAELKKERLPSVPGRERPGASAVQTRLAVLSLPFLFASLCPAPAAGGVWRTPESFAPAVGPAEVSVAGSSVPEVRELSRRHRRKFPEAPLVVVDVVDESGRPAPGTAVRVGLKIGREHSTWEGATDRAGRFVFRPSGIPGIRRIDVDVAWDGATRGIGVDLEPDDERWEMEKPRYRNSAAREWEGDCGNLFALQQGPGRVSLRVTRPDSLLACRGIEYGLDRKSDAIARLDAIGRRDVNEGDKNFFSSGDEAKMGVEAANHFDQEFERVEDPVITGYVQGLVERIVAASDVPDMPVNLRVVHTEGVNAFATAGGNVYVFTGLIAAAENEAQLAGVLAHEVSHVVARHVTEGASRQMKQQGLALVLGLGLAAAADLDRRETEQAVMASMMGAGLYGMRHGRQAETEADLLGSQYLWKAGWDPEAIAGFFAVLQRQGGASPPGWLSTHPSHERRIENGIHWSRAFLPAKERYLVSTDEFERVKRRVQALPPPRKRPAAESEALGLAPFYAETSVFREVALEGLGSLLGGGS